MIARKIMPARFLAILLGIVTIMALPVISPAQGGVSRTAKAAQSGAPQDEQAVAGYLDILAGLIQKNGGTLIQWPRAEKEQLYAQLGKIPGHAARKASLDEALSAHAFEGEISLNSAITALYQRFENAPYTIKALYSQLGQEYFGKDEEGFLLPAQTDISEGEAVAIAKGLLPEVSDIAEAYADVLAPQTAFLTNGEYGERVWLIHLSATEYTADYYIVIKGSTGKVIKFSLPGQGWMLAGEAAREGVPNGARYSEPSAFDMDEESVIRKARDLCVTTFQIKETEINQVEISAYFIYHEKFNAGHEPVWLAVCKQGDEVYRCLFAYNGSFIDTATGTKEFSVNVRRDPDPGDEQWPNGLIDEKGRIFSAWTPAEKAEVSKNWKPVIDQYLTTNPYYKNWDKQLYRITRYVYDLPQAEEMPHNDAKAIAVKEIEKLGASGTASQTRVSYDYFDRTDPAKPLWRFVFPSNSQDIKQYKVVIDAVTGGIEESFQLGSQKFMDIDY